MKWLLAVFINLVLTSYYAQNVTVIDTIVNHQKAISELEQAIKKNSSDEMLYYKLAERFSKNKQYKQCLETINNCLSLVNKSNNNKLLSKALYSKGRSLYYLTDRTGALNIWQEAIKVATSTKDYFVLAQSKMAIGALIIEFAQVEKNKSLYKSSDSFLKQSLYLLENIDSAKSNQAAYNLRLIATNFKFQNQYDSASFYFEKAMEIARTKDPGSYFNVITFYAEMLSDIKQYDKAQYYLNLAIEYAKQHKMLYKEKGMLFNICSAIYKNKNDFKESARYQDSAYLYFTKDFEQLSKNAHADAEAKFNNQLLKHTIEIEKQKKTRLYLIISGILLLVFTSALWWYNVVKKRAVSEKAKQKQISIDAFIEGEENEKIRIGRELHDGIAQEIVGVRLALQQSIPESKMVDELKRIALDIRNISHELMPQTLKEFGLKFAIEDSCQKLLNVVGIKYEIYSNLGDARFSNKLEITLYRTFQELLHNIIKHSKATEVLIQLRNMRNHILLVVEDNGIGLINNTSNGIGFRNLKNRVALIDGNIQFESSVAEGTTIIVRVPII
jgi:two-component system, NarL family, sensor kinase